MTAATTRRPLAVTTLLMAFLAMDFMPGDAAAVVTFYKMTWGQGFVQTADNTQPSPPSTDFNFDANFFFDTPGEVTSITFDRADNAGAFASGPLSFVDDSGDGTAWSFETATPFTTEADLLTAFPTGTYTVEMLGGTLGPITGTVIIGAGSFASGPELPFLINNTFANLQGMDANSAFAMDWNTPDVATTAVSVLVEDVVTGNEAFNFLEFPNPTLPTTTTIAGGTLAPGTDYLGSLEFSRGAFTDGTLNGALGLNGNSRGNSGFNTSVDFNFTTASAGVPEPTTLALLALGLAGIGFKRRLH